MYVVPFAILMQLRNGDLIQQHIYTKFCFKLGKNTIGTFRMLKVAFGEQTVGRTEVFEWFSKSKSSIISVEDKQLGCPLLDKQNR